MPFWIIFVLLTVLIDSSHKYSIQAKNNQNSLLGQTVILHLLPVLCLSTNSVDDDCS